MKDVLDERDAQMARLAMMIRIGLESAESTIPGINCQLAELAAMGITDLQIEGLAIYCRPAGPSSAYDDSFVIYQAAIILPGGVGCVLWDAADYDEHTSPPHGEPVDLRANFIPYDTCPPIVRALLVTHVGRLLDGLLGDVRLLGS